MLKFDSFDPLKAKQIADTEVAANALKREIQNILSSYVAADFKLVDASVLFYAALFLITSVFCFSGFK